MITTTPNREIKLTERQLEVLKLVADGYTNEEIAEKLIITRHTVKAHICAIYEQFGVNARVSLIVEALKKGFLELNKINS